MLDPRRKRSQNSLKTENVADVTVETCEFQEDPEESEFAMYRCTVVAGPEGAVLPGDEDPTGVGTLDVLLPHSPPPPRQRR